MFQNYYPNYNAYAQNPYQTIPQAAQQQTTPQSNIQWVQGIEAAKSYLGPEAAWWTASEI